MQPSLLPPRSPLTLLPPRRPGPKPPIVEVALLVAPTGERGATALRQAARDAELPLRDRLATDKAGKQRLLTHRSGRHALLGRIDVDAEAFTRLEQAGKLAAAVLALAPRTVSVRVLGCEPDIEERWLESLLLALRAHAFVLPSYRKPARAVRTSVQPLTTIALALDRLRAEADGNDLARWLTALPPNRLTPAAFRQATQALARAEGWRTRFYDERALKRLGAGAFLAVMQGSVPRSGGILHVSYRPRGARGAPVALVGKGITFDTGGTNLKSHKGMHGMHTDMGGSAAVLGTLLTLQRCGYRRPVDAWLAITDNAIGPVAYRPNEVVRALNGTSIEVVHTDAEGRMALADTLALAARARPRAIIDLATLTGACITALTERYAGAFTNRPQWRTALEAAGHASGERVWCLPSTADFDTELESKVADVIQCPVDGKGDHIYATRFLGRFVGDHPWLHLDLTPATRTGGLAQVPTEVTGFGVRYLSALLLDGGFPFD